MPDTFLPAAADIALAPYIARERKYEQTRIDAHEIDVAACRGVGRGFEPLYFKARTDEEIVAAARDSAERVRAFGESPRGRFCACIDELEAFGYPSEADRLRGFYARSISAINGPDPDPCAIGSCILILNEIGTEVARAGVAALAGLLVQKAA